MGPLGSGGGGPLLTKTLLFVGQGAGGRGGRGGGGANVLRAFDKASGKVVAEIDAAGAAQRHADDLSWPAASSTSCWPRTTASWWRSACRMTM